MSYSLAIETTATKAEKYEQLLPQVEALVSSETDLIANMANTAAVLKEVFDFWWVGFYLVKEDQLVLGPFQGPLACTRIPFDKGVCGACYSQDKVMLVPNVDEFPGHIACSSATKSEIVLPVKDKDGNTIAVLDIDSDKLSDFDEVDQKWLEQLVKIFG